MNNKIFIKLYFLSLCVIFDSYTKLDDRTCLYIKEGQGINAHFQIIKKINEYDKKLTLKFEEAQNGLMGIQIRTFPDFIITANPNSDPESKFQFRVWDSGLELVQEFIKKAKFNLINTLHKSKRLSEFNMLKKISENIKNILRKNWDYIKPFIRNNNFSKSGIYNTQDLKYENLNFKELKVEKVKDILDTLRKTDLKNLQEFLKKLHNEDISDEQEILVQELLCIFGTILETIINKITIKDLEVLSRAKINALSKK